MMKYCWLTLSGALNSSATLSGNSNRIFSFRVSSDWSWRRGGTSADPRHRIPSRPRRTSSSCQRPPPSPPAHARKLPHHDLQSPPASSTGCFSFISCQLLWQNWPLNSKGEPHELSSKPIDPSITQPKQPNHPNTYLILWASKWPKAYCLHKS